MIRLLVLSDTHGRLERAQTVLEHWRPRIQGLVHLGDFDRDGEALQKLAPELPLYVVRGNNDLAGRAPLEQVVTQEGHTLFMAHGNRQRVYTGLDWLGYAAEAAGAEVALFGHTHAPVQTELGGILFLNPGSLSAPRSSAGPTFATLELEAGQPPRGTVWQYVPGSPGVPLG